MTGPERIWIEGEEGCPYFYDESELADASGPLVGYIRADIHDEVVKALREAVDGLEAYVRDEYDFPYVDAAMRGIIDRARAALEKMK